MGIQAHEVCEGQNELIMSSMTVLKIFCFVYCYESFVYCYESLTFKMKFTHKNEGQSKMSEH
jgi:hypothetical protein